MCCLKDTINPSKRLEELDQLRLFCVRKVVELIDDVRRFPLVAQNRLSECPGLSVVDQPVTHADSPERWGPQLIGRRLRRAEHNGPIASADIVQQEVTIGVDQFVTKRARNCECPAIDDSADGSRLEGGNVTDGTANLIEMDGSSLGVSGGR